ncbi:universal stress protein [Neptunomonas antarctica]|uniref:Universal stress protein E n=1 Tax=Neptunomonas antarctica TaxID=619304 RepID=A0A1N7KDR2_9GAMM|nr:universal stress protein [Neptunomonas antarctica]SIS59610.1 universal stress protein E [Neptunomonas antarctica]
MKILRVLVHIDSDQVSDALMEKIRILAKQNEISIELFRCCYNDSLHRSYMFDTELEKHAKAGYLHQKERELIRIAEQLERQGLSVGYDVTWNKNAAEGVIKKALRFRADMVIASVGKHPLGYYIFRQGDWQLIAQCPVPLLLVKDTAWSAHPRIAAMVDPFHQCDEPNKLDHEILMTSNSIANLLLGELHVVHSFSSIPQVAIFDEHLTMDYATLHQKVKTRHTEVLQALVEGEALASAILNLEEGEIHEVIPALVKRENINILIMGSIARGVVERFLIGSSVERVLDKVDCDVLLIKQPGFVSPVTE